MTNDKWNMENKEKLSPALTASMPESKTIHENTRREVVMFVQLRVTSWIVFF